MSRREGIDLDAIRCRLERETGPRYWRSLEELAGTKEFQDWAENEFPQLGADWRSPVSRRTLLKTMAASLALAGAACTRQPAERIVPYVRAPEEIVPGKPLLYATGMPLAGFTTGLLVESHMGRPTKVEGNPAHPASLGATDAFAQASVLTLYDPQRSQVVTRRGRISSWVAFIGELGRELEAQRLRKGAGLRILTDAVGSPTLAAQIRGLLQQYPEAGWYQWEPARPPADTMPLYQFDQTDVIVSLDSDFLTALPASLRYARQFAGRRRPDSVMNRLYVAEPIPSSTGGMADHRLPVRAGDIEALARALAKQLGLSVDGNAPRSVPANWIPAAAKDLQAHRGRSLVIPGEYQPPEVHALARMMNEALGNVGRTVTYAPSPLPAPVDYVQDVRRLVGDLNKGQIELLLIIGANPVYTAPADLGFTSAMQKCRLRVRAGLYEDETSAMCQWHIPLAHFLESWSDGRAYDGTATILQPLIEPLYGGKSAHEIIAAFSGNPDQSGHDIVQAYWSAQAPGPGFDALWKTALHDGVVPNTASTATLEAKPAILVQSAAPGDGLEVVFRPDPTIFDGQFSNNGWLQELPKPVTKITWDNVAHISPATAQRLGVAAEDVVELRLGGRSVRAPVWILPGQADESVTLHLGYGRRRAGNAGTGAGFDAYALRTSPAMWMGTGLEVRKTGARYPLARTQHHHAMEGRHLVRAGTLEEFRKEPRFAQHMEHEPPTGLTLYPQYPYQGYAWGMTIDLNACTGCSACVVACQAENNIPVVGKTEVARGREMHWLRIDRYNEGGLDNPRMYYQPVLCMHCETAPCEVVCPVNATVHSSEGLNQMIYNRCVGTRYCSNNCPYKVRRFNFFLYSDWYTQSLYPLRNPDVTVRSRGVMEKCTYCVQRINAARIEAEKEDRRVRDGDVITACQGACPTQAIVFGDINDKNSRVAKLKAGPLNYGLLGELNTRPRTTYLARVRNPNPELET
jgi:molybdopterin-containing oxidoreductase family iron-sulfur binding subunit